MWECVPHKDRECVKMRVRMREHIYYTGNYAEVEVFPVIEKPKSRRAKCQPTSEMQEIINQEHAERKLTRLVHTNFNNDDYSLHLTYSDGHEPESLDEVNRDIKNYLRRLRRKYKKAGVEFKYIYAVELSSRFHIHAFLSQGAISREEIEDSWGKGTANADRLQFSNNGVADLSRYVQKQHLNYKRWQGSRNLVQPVEREHFISKKVAQEYSDSWNTQELIEKRFPDYFLVLDESTSVTNAINGFEYTRVFLCRKDAQLSVYSTSFAEREDRLNALKEQEREEIWVQPMLC